MYFDEKWREDLRQRFKEAGEIPSLSLKNKVRMALGQRMDYEHFPEVRSSVISAYVLPDEIADLPHLKNAKAVALCFRETGGEYHFYLSKQLKTTPHLLRETNGWKDTMTVKSDIRLGDLEEAVLSGDDDGLNVVESVDAAILALDSFEQDLMENYPNALVPEEGLVSKMNDHHRPNDIIPIRSAMMVCGKKWIDLLLSESGNAKISEQNNDAPSND